VDLAREGQRLLRQVEPLLVLGPLLLNRGAEGPDLRRQPKDLPREVQEIIVLTVLLLHRPPLLVGDDLALRVGAILADHHEGGEEDGLERDDHGEQAVGIGLDAEADPAAEPDDVDVDERHRAGECRDPVGHTVLRLLGALLRVLQERRIDGGRKLLGRQPPVKPVAERLDVAACAGPARRWVARHGCSSRRGRSPHSIGGGQRPQAPRALPATSLRRLEAGRAGT
jgi:hypothetical protein